MTESEKELNMLRQKAAAWEEFQNKTNWVQNDSARFDYLLPWGMHRADVLRLHVEALEAKLALYESHTNLPEPLVNRANPSNVGRQRLEQIVTAAGAEPCDADPVFDSVTHGEIAGMARSLLFLKSPPGWKLVPLEPTPAMLAEIELVKGWTSRALASRYKAAVAAAPDYPKAEKN